VGSHATAKAESERNEIRVEKKLRSMRTSWGTAGEAFAEDGRRGCRSGLALV
jgi:hypothetical protein